MKLEQLTRLFPKWREFAIGAIVLVTVTFFLVGHFSAEGRFESFANRFYKRYAEKLSPVVTDIMHSQKNVASSSQFHFAYWHNSKDRLGDDNSWGTYTHSLLFHFTDEPDRILIVSARMNFGRVPEGMVLPTGRSKGWVRFGDVDVEATVKHTVGGEVTRSRGAIPHRALHRDALSQLADQIAESM